MAASDVEKVTTPRWRLELRTLAGMALGGGDLLDALQQAMSTLEGGLGAAPMGWCRSARR